MNKSDLIYAAGFFDGEGCITLTHENKRTPGTFQFTVGVTNTDYDVIFWFKKLFGDGYVCVDRRTYNGHLNCYNIRWRGSRALEILQLLRPYCKVKSRQIDVVSGLTFGYSGTRLPVLELRKRVKAMDALKRLRGKR